MTANEFFAKYGADKETRDLLFKANELDIGEFGGMLKSRFPGLTDGDVSSLYDDIAGSDLGVAELDEVAGGLPWKKPYPDPARKDII